MAPAAAGSGGGVKPGSVKEPPPQINLDVGWSSGRFWLEKRIGKGGFGVVFKARDGESDESVACKVSYAKVPGTWEYVSVMTEVAILRVLKHPSCCAMVDFVSTLPGVFIVVLEYMPGGALRDWLADRPYGLGRANSALVVGQVLLGLHYLHMLADPVLHRDIKPCNILMLDREDGSAILKLSDFGLACFASDAERMSMRCGSPGFVAPEIISGKPYHTKVDIFSVGALFHVVATGQPMFTGETAMEAYKKNARGLKQLKDPFFDDKAAADLCWKLCAFKPDERVSAAEAMEHEFVGSRSALETHVNERLAQYQRQREAAKPKAAAAKDAPAARAGGSKAKVQPSEAATPSEPPRGRWCFPFAKKR